MDLLAPKDPNPFTVRTGGGRIKHLKRTVSNAKNRAKKKLKIQKVKSSNEDLFYS